MAESIDTKTLSPARLELFKEFEYDSAKKRRSLTRSSNVGSENNENERISSKLNRILVQNTPTPLLNQKYANRVKHLNSNNVKLSESQRKSKNKIIMVPNTPIFNQLTNNGAQNSRRMKKLFNTNDNLNEEDTDLPGDDLINLGKLNELNPIAQRITTAETVKVGKKVSALFKPKSCQDEEDHLGSDLSFDTLQKRQRRRRNQFVVRRSEVFPAEIENKSTKKISIEPNNLEPEPAIPSSPIIVQSMQKPAFKKPANINNQNDDFYDKTADTFQAIESRNVNDKNNLNSTQTDPNCFILPNEYLITPIKTNTPYSKSAATSLFTSKTNYEHDYSTFTKVTRQIDTIFGLDTETRINEDESSDESKNKSKESEMSKADDDDCNDDGQKTPIKDLLSDTRLVDLILFDGLTINSAKKAENKIFTGIHDKFNKNKAHCKARKNPFGLVDKTNTFSKVKMQKAKSDKDVYVKKNKNATKPETPKINKIINIAHFGLSKDQTSKMKNLIDSVNQNNASTLAKSNDKYSQQTTHLLVDFKTSFETADSLSLNKKCLLVLAALNNCKIVRFEWLKHSQAYNTWLDEADYLIESYVEEDLSEYDQDEFDIKLIKFIRNLKKGKHSKDVFSLHKNVYVMEDHDVDESCLNESELDYEKFETSNSCFLYKENSTFNFITDLLIKCGANLTSRVGLAEIIIAIDDGQMDKTELRDSFEACLIEFKKSIRKKCGVKVISSEWVLDSLLNSWDPNTSVSNYEIASVYPEKKSSNN